MVMVTDGEKCEVCLTAGPVIGTDGTPTQSVKGAGYPADLGNMRELHNNSIVNGLR